MRGRLQVIDTSDSKRIVVVQIIRPTKISDISVIFHGEQGETIIEFEAIDVLEPLFAKERKPPNF